MNIKTKNPDGSVSFRGHIVDVLARRIFDGEFTVDNGKIRNVRKLNGIDKEAPYFMPGFIDSHVHIESSMMMPVEFARVACSHGSVGAVCDPHEIANVLGVDGVKLMLDSAKVAMFHFAFGVPSCVPAVGGDVETSGHVLDVDDVAELLERPDIHFLSEMMNWPGVLNEDPNVMAKIEAAKRLGKPIDGHAPGLVGEQRVKYADAGISTDHECTTLVEGREAIKAGMKVLIREGSAAKDYMALASLISEAPDKIMFCTDDSHPTDLVRGHIDGIVRRAIEEEYDLMDILGAACVNPKRHYNLDVGLLQEGDSADFIIVSNLTSQFKVISTYIKGNKVFSSRGKYTTLYMTMNSCMQQMELIQKYKLQEMNATPIEEKDIACDKSGDHDIIDAIDGKLITGHVYRPVTYDVQKIVVYNRYTPGAKPQVGFIRGFNIKKGAIAQSIAHDSHNIIAIGSKDKYIVDVINRVIALDGGIAASDGVTVCDLPLPIGGLMSTLTAHELSYKSYLLEELLRKTGCTLQSPFITLSFMALPVIPSLKLTDKGLFDSNNFKFIR